MAEFVGRDYRTVLKNEVEVTAENMTYLFERFPVYVLGYGSLLYSAGWYRRFMRRIPKKHELIEIELDGYERGPWGLYGDTNFYGVIRNTKKSMNGVLVRVHDLDDWVGLMTTEMIVGLYQWANYRVVDVTDNIAGDGTRRLPTSYRVHMVCNRPINRKKMRNSWPAFGYYDRVWEGVRLERSKKFQKEFLKTGGFQSNRAVRAYIHESWRKRGSNNVQRNVA